MFKMKDWIPSVIIPIFAIVILFVPSCSGGECCRVSHRSLHVWDYDQVWCPVYCCGDAWPMLRCCSEYLSRAPEHYRDHFCAAWFRHPGHIWLPILTGLIIVIIAISCIVCCCRLCCIF